MEWNGMEWNGMEWNGMEWNGMEWKEQRCISIMITINNVEIQLKDGVRGGEKEGEEEGYQSGTGRVGIIPS